VKRFLRLYPALFLCLVLTILSIWQTGYFDKVDVSARSFFPWVAAQATFFQFYNPDFLRNYGVGVINGSLWTISVEIQFYILTPFVFVILNSSGKRAIVMVFLALVTANILNSQLNEEELPFEKLFGVSFAPWLYMFLLGALVYKHQHIITFIVKTPFLLVLLAFVSAFILTGNLGWGNNINPIGYLTLTALIVKCAFTFPRVSDSILNRNDLSYGIYIMHMPIVNYMLNANFIGVRAVVYTLLLTVAFAVFSWFLIERPSLRMKKFALRST
jgi:peptidoglycan/LPS O-acetylase OafA/YrhL